MLKASKKAGGSPLLNGGKAGGGSARPAKPNSPDSMKNRVLVSEAPGGPSRKGTFSASRKGDDHNPMACGYTKLK